MYRNIPAPGGLENPSGNSKFYFIPVEEVERIVYPHPKSDNPKTVDAALIDYLSGGSVWYSGAIIAGELNSKCVSKPVSGGRVWDILLEGMIACDYEELQDVLDEMSGGQFIVLRLDTRGFYKLMGTVENPLFFAYEGSSQNLGEGVKGYRFKFFFEGCDRPEYFLDGEFEVDGSTTGTATAPTGVPGLEVTPHALGDHTDVDFTPAPEDGDALVYDLATDTWKPGSAGGMTTTDYMFLKGIGLGM